MTNKQAISLKYNRVLFWAALAVFAAELLFVIISYHRAFPLFFTLLGQAGSISSEEANAQLAQHILISPARLQIFFFASLALLVLSFFRFYSTPDKLHVSIPSRFYKPIDVNFKPELLHQQIEADPTYQKSMAKLQDNKAYERRAKRQFFSTSLMLLVAFYLSNVLFKANVLETLAGWYTSGGLLARLMDWMHGFLKSGEDVQQLTANFFNAVFSAIIFFGIILLIYKFRGRKKYKTEYSVETYKREDSYCGECGYAAVELLVKVGSVETGRTKVGSERYEKVIREHYEETTVDGRVTGKKLKGCDVKVYECDVFQVSYEDTYRCRQCSNQSTRARLAKEYGPSRYIKTAYRSV